MSVAITAPAKSSIAATSNATICSGWKQLKVNSTVLSYAYLAYPGLLEPHEVDVWGWGRPVVYGRSSCMKFARYSIPSKKFHFRPPN